MNDHLVHVQQVFDALKDAGLTASPSKCVFGARSLSYLGHLVGVGYVSVPEARVRAIKEYRRPVTRRDLRAFWAWSGIIGGLSQALLGGLGHSLPL